MQLSELGSHTGREHPCGESLLRKQTERKREKGKEERRKKVENPRGSEAVSKQLAVGDGCCTGNRNPLPGKPR